MLTAETTKDRDSEMSSTAAESVTESNPNKCRVCLKHGDIPIFGTVDISADVNEFGGIEVLEDNRLPQHLCDACHTLLEAAVVFRKTAQESDSILNETNSLYDSSVESENPNYTRVLDKLLGTEPNLSREYIECDDTPSEEDVPEYESSDSGKEDQLSQDSSEDKNIEMQLLDLKDGNGADNENEMIMIIVSDKNKKEAPHNAASIDCEECSLTFNSSEQLKEHNTEKHSQSLLHEKCEVCFKIVNKKEYKTHLKEHREKYKMKVDKKYGKVECHYCGKKISKSYFSHHVKLHGSVTEQAESMKECPFCKKKFKANYLTDHIQRVHPSGNRRKNVELDKKEEKLPCPVCDKNIVESKFKVHVARHGGPTKQYVCDQCGKVFKYPSPFKTHCLTHGGELKYKCQFCPYRGLHKALLKVHVRTHTGDYNYKCTICPARFITKSNLSKHIARHNGDYKFFCDVCNKGFYSKWNMDKHHKNIHSGKKECICEICGKGYGHRDTMLSHQLKVHGRQKLTDCRGRVPSYLKLEQKADLDDDL